MTYDEIRQSYISCLCDLVGIGDDYSSLIWHLYTTVFDTSGLLPMDTNRADDGERLRWRFAEDCDIPQFLVSCAIDDGPCSVLEMMVALSCRIETNIMSDPDIGNRTSTWFTEMLISLGLYGFNNYLYDAEQVGYILYRFMRREYDYNGKGGLFTLSHPYADMRTVEIWCQMNWYLGENF